MDVIKTGNRAKSEFFRTAPGWPLEREIQKSWNILQLWFLLLLHNLLSHFLVFPILSPPPLGLVLLSTTEPIKKKIRQAVNSFTN